MRIALIINELNVRGGTHKQFLRLCEYLERNKVDFLIITKYYDVQKTYPDFMKYEIKYLKKEPNQDQNKYIKFIFDMYDTVRLSKFISKDTTICNIHDNGLLLLFPLLKIYRKKIIWQVNDLPGYFKVGNSKNTEVKFPYNVIKFLSKNISIRCVDQITVNVTKNADRIREFFGLEALTFHCGIDSLKNFKIHSQRMNKNQIKLLTTGVFFPYRNYETIITVVKKLKDEGYDIILDIIGETEWHKAYTEKIVSMIKNNKLEDNIIIHGQVIESDFKLLFDNADVFLFLNVDQSWGLVVFEAMSVGLPTIVSNSVGAVEILTDDVAVIIDPINVELIKAKILEICNDELLYSTYSMKGFNHVKNMTWENMYCSKMLSLFNKIVG